MENELYCSKEYFSHMLKESNVYFMLGLVIISTRIILYLTGFESASV